MSRFWRTANLYWKARRRFLLLLGRAERELPPPSALDEELPLPEAETPEIAAARAGVAENPRHDLVCLPIIDWDFRFQRPQQLLSRYAAAGHRVFYVAQQFRSSGPSFLLKPKAENVWEVSLRGPARNVYRESLEGAVESLFLGLNALRREVSLGATALLIQLPFWWPLARRARQEFAWPVIYDCMDLHSGFSTNRPEMVATEEDLLSSADLVVASSKLLFERATAKNSRVLLLPNACDYEHFAGVGPASNARPIVGYYGAIADWFDAELVAELAEKRKDWDFLLVGSTFAGDTRRLERLPNVRFTGELPYADLPKTLERFDVTIIPFRRLPLTEATSPVKAFEILAAGKPLVSVPLPEVAALAPLVRLASDASEFEREIEAALAETDPAAAEKRRAFARENTWQRRHEELAPAVRAAFPRASVVVVTYNNRELNRLCLGSLSTRTEWPNFEIVAVDNASSDGSVEELREAEKTLPNLRLIANEENRGFAAANNQGLAVASGEYLVLLNNDTVVTRGWLAALIRHLAAEPKLGLVGPSTNAVANEAKVEVAYEHIADLPAFAARFARENDGRIFAIPMLAMFCLAMKRKVFEQVGPLDERFGIGMFEDDDYNRRVREAGWEIRCARDAFVHHWQKASFRLLGEEKYLALFEENRKKYEEKWGEPWKAEGIDVWKRPDLGFYRDQLESVRARVAESQGLVLFLPSVGWGIHLFQRPHHLARTFAREGLVAVFDSSNAHDDVNGFKEIEPNLFLYRGPEEVLQQLPDPLLWAFPYNYHAKQGYPSSARVVYDWIDDLTVFPYDRELLERNHAQALSEATVVASVARRLHEQALAARPDAIYLANGVEYERFANGDAPLPEDRELAAFRASGHPIAGYYGALAEWFDYELLDEVARLKPDWNFLLIGPMYDQSLRGQPMLKRPNVVWLGPRDYHSLPGYLRLFDVATIPFRINDITLATSPLKLYEYFAGGKPAVTTPMPECQAYSEVEIAKDAREFAAALERARERGRDPRFRDRLRELGRQNSWSARTRSVREALAKADSASPRPAPPRPPAAAVPATGLDRAATAAPSEIPARFRRMSFLTGRCNVCGRQTRFYYGDPLLHRESLTCEHCLTTSRYRSIARGLLRSVRILAGVEAESLADLARTRSERVLSIYDTQVPFAYEGNAYPIPDLLAACPWLTVETSQFQPKVRRGKRLGGRTTNQDLEALTFGDASFDVVVTSDVMEHVRLDDRAHREIRRVLKPGGIYLFTVPHFRDQPTLVRVEVVDPDRPEKDRYLTEREYHGDANAEEGRALSYRSYGTDLDATLEALGFEVEYSREDLSQLGILNTELFFCRLRG
jgi:GT2 family glycosyltransferase/SAM-dependent methyltransferase